MTLPPGPRLPGVVQTLAYSYLTLPFFEQCAKRYGDLFTLHLLGFGDYVFLSAPEHLKQAFTADHEQLQVSEGKAMLKPLFGANSVVLLDGKEHLRQRRLLMPPFHGERMHAYANLIVERTSAAIDRMPIGSPFALFEVMQAITLEVILRAVFGLREGAQMKQLEALLVEFIRPLPAFLFFIPPEYQHYADVPFSPYRTFLKIRAQVDRMVREIIRERRAASDAERTDILSMLLQARDEEGRPMTEDELRDELITLLLAGYETTATALAFTFAFILKYPHAEARLRAELEGTRGSAGEIDIAALTSSAYLDAVIKESMRLRPIVSDIVRQLQKPMTIAGYEIPEKVFLTPCIYLAHRRAEQWPEPNKFLPERFLSTKVDPYSWFPFGGGTRRCLGMAFALYEMKLVLGVTMLRARLRLWTADPLKVVRRGFALAPKGGTPVVLVSRSNL